MITLIKQNRIINICLLFFLSLSILALCIPSFYSFPLNYGWWQAYVYFEQNNLELYKDIDLVFPPFFIKITELFFNISQNVHVSFIFGIIRIFLFFLIFFLIFRNFFALVPSLISSFIIVIYQLELSTFIPDDYHIMERTLFAICILFFLKLTLNPKTFFLQVTWTTLLSIFLILLILCKQNVGVFVTASVFLSLIVLSYQKHIFKINIIIFFISFVLFTPAICYLFEISTQELFKLLFQNDSKGNTFYLLTKFITIDSNRIYLLYGSLLGLITFIYYEYFIHKKIIFMKYNISFENVINFSNKYNITSLLVWLPLIIYFYIPQLVILLGVSLSTFLFLISLFSNQNNRYSFICYLFIGLLYASTLTSTLAIDSSIMITTFIYGYIFNYIFNKNELNKYKMINSIQLIIIIPSIILSMLIKKIETPYNWWGFSTSDFFYSKHVPPYKELKGLRVDLATLEIMDNIKNDILLYSKTKNDLYLYPHLAYFYFLNNKLPPSKNPVQWFDVITNKNIINEIKLIKEKKPRVIIMFDPPISTYAGHEELKSDYLYQYQLLDAINENYELKNYVIFKNSISNDFEIDKGYQNIFSKTSTNNYIDVVIRLKKDITLKELMEINNRQINNSKTYAQPPFKLINYDEKGVTFKLFETYDQFQQQLVNKDFIFKKNGLLTINVDYLNADYFIKFLGNVPKQNEKWYSLKTFVRKN